MADTNPHEEFVFVRLGADTTAPPGRVSKAAYDAVWKAKGWTIVDDDEATAALSSEPEPEPTTTRKKA